MHGLRGVFPALILLLIATHGCGGPAKRTLTVNEPALSTIPEDSGTVVAERAKPAQTVSVVDRHPLLSKPRQYYESTNSNKAVKTAAAAVIGVPAGIFGELKQIVVGAPAPQPPGF